MWWLPQEQEYNEKQIVNNCLSHRAVASHLGTTRHPFSTEHSCLWQTPCLGPQSHQRRPAAPFPRSSSLWGSGVFSPLGTLLSLSLVQLFYHHLEEYNSFPLIPNTSLLLRQDRAAETSCWLLWHAMSTFWLQCALCTQQQTETWQSLRSLHRPTKPSPASSTAYPWAFMEILHAHRTENRDPGWSLQRIFA